MESGRLALGDHRRCDRLGITLVDHAVDRVHGGQADLAIQLGDHSGEALALVGQLVNLGAGEAVQTVAEDHVERFWGEDVGLDGVEHHVVELLHADGHARAGGAALLSGAAGVQVGPLLRLPPGRHADRASAGAAAQERREHAALAGGDGVLAVALALVAVPGLERADRQHALERRLVDGRFVAVARGDLAVVDEVPTVERIRQHRGDMLGPPRSLGVLPWHVGAARRLDPLAGEAVGDLAGAADTVEGLAEDSLHDLELRSNVVGDDEALPALAAVDGVAEGGVPVLPEPLLRAAAHPAHHVAGQLLAVALSQPSEDRADQLAKGAVAGVGLREGDHVDVGLVERREGAKAIEHVSCHAAERPDVEAIHAGRAFLLRVDGVALGLGALDELEVRGPLLRGAPADTFVDEPIPRGDGDAVGLRPPEDLFSLLFDAFVLARVRAAEVGGADHGHGALWVRGLYLT